MDINREILGLLGLALFAFALGLGAALYLLPRRADPDGHMEALLHEVRRLRAAAAARDKAEAANEAKSRFLATVSHEIRTPLNGVLGLAQLLSMTRLEAEQASYVDSIRDCARALAQLVDDILDFSKIEAGRLDLRREEFALAPLVEGVVELLAPRAQGKGLEIASHVAAETPERIVGDPARLRQVLINLAGNAVNFTQKGGVGVSVAPAADGSLRFVVEDTGPGISLAARAKIFEEFEQAEPLATRAGGGAGLGLAIARRLVAKMGGTLALETSSESGSRFVFTLPAKTGRTDRPRPLEGQSALILAASRFEGPFLARYLEEAGAKAQIAASGGEARALLETSGAKPPQVAIVDCALGLEAAESLAERAHRAGVARCFLLFSPLERRAHGEAALKDFDGWLVKPVRAASLVARLDPAAKTTAQALAPQPAPTLPGLTALIAEDNEINALIALRQLEALGAAPTRAEDGEKVVALAQAAIDGKIRRFDVILMDLFMPKLDGLEAIRRIRAAESRAGAARTPVLALTASASREDAEAARAAGADAVVTKPVELAAMEEAIRAVSAAGRATFATNLA
jgi:signal transduction histidine kinase/CheY-like chemotaxis protein